MRDDDTISSNVSNFIFPHGVFQSRLSARVSRRLMAQRFVYVLRFVAILTARPRGERYPFYAPVWRIYRRIFF